MNQRRKLSDDEVARELTHLPEWRLTDDGKIARDFKLKDFKAALGFIVRIGLAAEAMDHHPEIYNVYSTVKIALNTHDAQGLTPLDFELARQIDALIQG